MTIVSISITQNVSADDSDSFTEISGNFPPLAGDEIEVESSGHGDVRWILPGPRPLDPKIFGTVSEPLGFEDDVGVPIAARNLSGNAWTTTKMPTPFSDNFKQISGEYELEVDDKTLFDDLDSKDKVNFDAEFTSVKDKNENSHTYKLKVNKIFPWVLTIRLWAELELTLFIMG